MKHNICFSLCHGCTLRFPFLKVSYIELEPNFNLQIILEKSGMTTNIFIIFRNWIKITVQDLIQSNMEQKKKNNIHARSPYFMVQFLVTLWCHSRSYRTTIVVTLFGNKYYKFLYFLSALIIIVYRTSL